MQNSSSSLAVLLMQRTFTWEVECKGKFVKNEKMPSAVLTCHHLAKSKSVDNNKQFSFISNNQ